MATSVPNSVHNGADRTPGLLRRLDNLTSKIPARKLIKVQVLGLKRGFIESQKNLVPQEERLLHLFLQTSRNPLFRTPLE